MGKFGLKALVRALSIFVTVGILKLVLDMLSPDIGLATNILYVLGGVGLSILLFLTINWIASNIKDNNDRFK